MATTGQRCPLCGESLLKFLFNPDGDYILNCSSRVCLYGVLHARVFRADQQPPAMELASIIDGAPGTCDVTVPVGQRFGGGDGGGGGGVSVDDGCGSSSSSDGRNASNEVSNQVDLFSTFGGMDDKSTISMMDMANPTGASDGFPDTFDFYAENRDADEDMLNQWVRELSEQSNTAVVASPMPQMVPDLPPASPLEYKVEPAPEQTPTPLPSESRVPPQRTTTKRHPKPSVKSRVSPAPLMRKSAPISKPQVNKLALKSTKPKLLVPKVEKEIKLPARLQKSQAIASMLKSHLGATDDVPSEASSDSGIQSDASSDLSSSSSSLTPIQRLLHIEEAKKRSWGVTGMPGFKPSAATKERQRKRPAPC